MGWLKALVNHCKNPWTGPPQAFFDKSLYLAVFQCLIYEVEKTILVVCLSPILHLLSDCKPLWKRHYYLQHVCIVDKSTGFGFLLGLFDNTVADYSKINS